MEPYRDFAIGRKHLQAAITTEAFEALQPRVLGTTKERILRELAEALESLTAKQTLVLQFDDLHWSDSVTLDLISYVARRSQPARLLIIGTYRPSDVERRGHPLNPLKHDLHVHRYCEELAIAPLSETAVASYLTMRLDVPSSSAQPGFQQLTRIIHQHTEGNPLFMELACKKSPPNWRYVSRKDETIIGRYNIVGKLELTPPDGMHTKKPLFTSPKP
jgi:hypothetical protein